MPRPPRLLIAALAALLLLAVGSARGLRADPADVFEAGFAKGDLTPDKPVPLGGYAARKGKLSTGVHDPVEVRAACFRRDKTTVALVSVDLIGVSAKVRSAVEKRLADLGSLDLVLAATHNHAGPGGLSDLPIWRPAMGPFDAASFEQTADRIADCIRRAHANLAPARIAHTSALIHDLQHKRSGYAWQVDDALKVLRIDDLQGRSRGVLCQFTAHSTLLGPEVLQISAGWPGVLRRVLERDLPGTTALFLNGPMGNVAPKAIPARGGEEGPFTRIERYGGELADCARRLHGILEGNTKPSAHLVVEHLVAEGHTILGALLGRPGDATLSGLKPFELPMTRLRIGDVQLVTVPGEPTREALGGSGARWIVSCAQDHLGHFVSRNQFWQGGYESDMSFFGPGAAEAMRRALDDRALPIGPLPRKPLPPHAVVAIRASEAPDSLRRPRRGYRLGFRHGLLLRAPIREFLASAEETLKKEALARGAGVAAKLATGLSDVPAEDLVLPLMVRAARRLQPHIPVEYEHEMLGIADAAGVPYDAILLANTFLTLAEQTDPLALLNLPARCTNVVAMGDATSMGQLIHASTLDWGMHDVLKGRTYCMVMEPEIGHPFVSVGWPGMVGTLRAMGAQGLAITEESCAAPKDTGLDGEPINLLMRQIVQYANDLDQATGWARKIPGTCGYKITISDGRRLDARVVERTARHGHVRKPLNGLIFGCDPEAPPECFVGERDPAIPPNDGSSARRYPALRKLLDQAHGKLRTPLVSWALSTRDGGVLNENTMLACVFEPQIGRFHVALGDDVPPVDDGDFAWEAHDLLPLLSPGARAKYARPARVTEVGDVETQELVSVIPSLRRLAVSFDSPLPSGRARNDRVKAELWLPRDAIGVMIEMPAWKESNLAGHRLMALTLARKKIATFILPLPYQDARAAPGVRSGAWTLSANLARTREALYQGIADAARASLWLEEAHGFEPARQGVSGVSLGGHVAAVAYGAYPERFAAGVFILAGGRIERSFLHENRTLRRMREQLLSRGVTPEEARSLIGVMDPLTYAKAERGRGVLLIAATEDPVVPPDNVKALAAAYGGAPIEWLEGDHYAPIRPDLFLRMIRRMGEHCANAFGGH